jgi:hypothetical protein
LNPGISRAIYLKPIDPEEYPQADAKALKSILEQQMIEKLIASKATWINPTYFTTT